MITLHLSRLVCKSFLPSLLASVSWVVEIVYGLEKKLNIVMMWQRLFVRAKYTNELLISVVVVIVVAVAVVWLLYHIASLRSFTVSNVSFCICSFHDNTRVVICEFCESYFVQSLSVFFELRYFMMFHLLLPEL